MWRYESSSSGRIEIDRMLLHYRLSPSTPNSPVRLRLLRFDTQCHLLGRQEA